MFEVFGLGAEFTFDANGTERIQDVVNNLQSLSSAMGTSAQDVQAYSNTLSEFSGILADMGKQMMLAGMATTTAALYGVGKAADWQTQMIDAARYMTDTSAEAQARYNAQLKETAQLLGTSKEEINAAVIAYMQMGKSEDDALRLAKNAGYAGVAWDIVADEVADSFKSIKAAFNINLEDQDMYQKYLDNINEVGNSTAATSKDVVRFLAAGGAALHNTSKVSIEEAMGMAAGMRAATLPVGEFSTMMIRLGNNFAKGKLDENFKKLGVDTRDSAGNLRSFAEVLYDVQKQWNSLDETTKSSFLTSTGGVYADRLALYMGVGDEYKKGTEIASQDNTGSAEAEFNRVTDTMNFALMRLKIAVADFGTAFWGTLLPPLTKFVNVMTQVVTKISDFMQAHPVIMKILSSFILLSGVVMTLGGAFLLVSSFLTKMLQVMVTGNNIAVMAKSLFSGLGLVYKNLGSSIVGLIKRYSSLALAMGIVYVAWKYDFFNIRSLVEDVMGRIKYTIKTVQDLLSDEMSVQDFQANIQKLNNSDSVFDKIALGATKAALAIKGLAEYMSTGGLSDDMFQKLNAMGLMPFISIVIGLGMRFKALFEGIKEGFKNTVETVNSWVREKFGPPFQWLHDHVLLPVAKAIFGVDESCQSLIDTTDGIQFVDLDAMFGDIGKWERLGKAIGAIGAGFLMLKSVSSVITILGKVGTIIRPIITVLGKFGGVILKVARFIGSLISSAGGLGSIFSTIGGALSAAGSAIMSALSVIGSAIAGAVSAIGAPVIAIIVVVVSTVLSFALKFKEQFLAIIGTVKDTFFTVIGGIKDKFCGVVESIKEKFGEFKTAIQPAIENVKGAISNIVDAFVSLKNGIVKVAQTPEFQSFVGVLLDKLSTVGAIITSVVIPAFNFLQVVLGQVAEFVIGVLGSAFTGIIEIVKGVATGIMDFFSGIVNVVSGIINTIVGLIDGLVNGDFTQFKEGLSQIGEGIWQMLSGVGEAIMGIFGGIIEFLGGLITEFFDAGVNIIKGLIDGIVSIGQNLWNSLKEVFQSLIDNVKGIFGIHSPSTVFSDIGMNIIQGLIDGISGMISGVIEVFGSLFSSITDTVGGWIDTAIDWGSNLIDNISSGISSAKDWVCDRASDVVNGIKDTWDSVATTAIDWGSNLISNISSGVSSAKEWLTSNVSGICNTISNGWNTLKNNAISWGSNMMTNIQSGINNAKELVTSAVTTVTTGIENTVNALRDKATSLGSSMITKYKEGIDSGKSPISSAISAIGSTVTSGLTSLKDSALSWGSNMVSGFADGIRNAASKAADAASSVVNKVKNFLGFNSPAKMGEGQHIVEWGYNMISGFADGINSADGMLQNTMANVITNPVKDILDNNANIPISTSLSQNSELNVSSSVGSYLAQIVGLLTTIAVAGGIVPSQINQSEGGISVKPLEERSNATNQTGNLIADTKASSGNFNVNIEAGAIQNTYRIDGDNFDKQMVIELIESMMDENMMPLLLGKIRELKVALNE